MAINVAPSPDMEAIKEGLAELLWEMSTPVSWATWNRSIHQQQYRADAKALIARWLDPRAFDD